MNDIEQPQSQIRDSSPGTSFVDNVWAVAADMYVQRSLHRYTADQFDSTDDQFQRDDQIKQRPVCAGCPPEDKKTQTDGLLEVLDKTGDAKQVAQEKAENDISERQEFLQGITIHFARYRKEENNRWMNKGREIIDLFDPDHAGGDRVDRYETLKRDMNGAKVGIVFSEPTVFEDYNYLQVFVDKGDTIEMYAIEHRGDIDDLTMVYNALAGESRDTDVADDASFTTPLYFADDLSFSHIAEVIEDNFASEESKMRSQDYLNRLHRDVTDVSLIERYQQEVEQEMQRIEQELLANTKEGEGFALAIIGMMVNAQSVEIRSHSVEDAKEVMEGIVSVRQDFFPMLDQLVHDEKILHIVDEQKIVTLNPFTKEQHIRKNTLIAPTIWEKVASIILDIPTEENGPRSAVVSALTQEPNEIQKSQNLETVWKQIAQDVLQISSEESGLLLLQLEQTKKKMDMASEVISQAVDMHVGIGAALFALDAMTLASIDTDLNNVDEMKSTAIDNSIVEAAQISNEERDMIFSLFSPDTDGNKEDEVQIIKVMREKDVDITTFQHIVDFVHVIETLPIEKQVKAIEKEKEITLSSLGFLWETVLMFRKSTTENNISAKDSHDESFSFAIRIWMMLKILNYYNALESLHKFVVKPRNNKILSEAIAQKKPEGLIQKEPAPWLLLAIIWHLAMIREQGMTTYTNQPMKKKAKKKSPKSTIVSRTSTPFDRVIFAYAS